MAAEGVRARLRRRLAEEYGMDEADLLLDRPPRGWNDLVTKDWLHLELSAVDARLTSIESRVTSIDDRLHSLESEIRAQTWKLIAAMTGLLGALVAAIKL